MRKAILLFALPLALASCASTMIPNTDVPDNGSNRKVVAFCEEYRHAMEDKNVAKILALVSPRYHDDHATPQGSDDTDYDSLRDTLATLFSKTSQIRYEIRYQKVIFTENNHVLVNYRFSASYRSGTTETERGEWHHTVADNQLDLVPDGEGFKILAGM